MGVTAFLFEPGWKERPRPSMCSGQTGDALRETFVLCLQAVMPQGFCAQQTHLA